MPSEVSSGERPAKRRKFDTLPPSTFQHEPLADPEGQIRLLRILPGRRDDNIQLEISTWDLGDVPAYYAISYTWGEKRCCAVWINNEVFHVRENCHYTAWQARLHYPGCYIWIDSVCIDQNHQQEKGHQVNMMGRIYEEATQVLACVGPHADDSSTLAEMATEVGPLGVFIPTKRPYREGNFFRKKSKTLPSRASGRLTWFLDVIQAFALREYWKRLWIVQELAAGNNSCVYILCGDDRILKRHVDLLFDIFLDQHNLLGDDTTLYRTTIDATPHSCSLLDALIYYQKYKCADMRDRLYGLLSLLDSKSAAPFIPDYGSPTIKLVYDLCARVDLSDVYWVTRAFEVNGHHPSVKELVQQRRVRNPVTFFQGSFKAWPPFTRTCFRSFEGTSGTFSLPIYRGARARDSESYCDQLRSAVDSSSHQTIQKQQYRVLHAADRPDEEIGLVCNEARVGDIILPYRADDLYDAEVLVIRQAKDETFDIVGQAVFYDDYYWKPDRRTHCSRDISGSKNSDPDGISRASIQLRLSVSDAIMLMAQSHDSTHQVGTQEDPHLRLERLITMPTLAPKGAASITPLGQEEQVRLQKRPSAREWAPRQEKQLEAQLHEADDIDFPDKDDSLAMGKPTTMKRPRMKKVIRTVSRRFERPPGENH